MILLIEDDLESRKALSDFLSVNGHEVQCARNGREALWLLAEPGNHPGLVFLDIQMPVLDGWAFLAERKKQSSVADVPVVILSGTCGLTERGKEAGAVAVLHKPVELRMLLEVIEHFSATNLAVS